jgi:hypothetical protein
MQQIDLAFISDPAEILDALRQSKECNTVIGLSAPLLGNGVFLTAVDNITELANDYSITLKGYDITGYILERNKVRLSDIRCVCPFKSPFNNPYMKEATGERFYSII